MIASMLALAFLAGNRQKSGDEMRHIDHAQSAQLVADSKHARRTTAKQLEFADAMQAEFTGEDTNPPGSGQRFRIVGGLRTAPIISEE